MNMTVRTGFSSNRYIWIKKRVTMNLKLQCALDEINMAAAAIRIAIYAYLGKEPKKPKDIWGLVRSNLS